MNLLRDRWMLVPIGLLAASVLSGTLTVLLAVAGRPLGVEPNSYERGLSHDRERTQAAANDRLAWIVSPEISGGRDGLPRLTISVTDKRGISIPAESATVEAIPIRNADLRTAVELAPEGEGRFAGEIPLRISGQWEFRIVVRRGQDVYTDTFRRSLAFGTSGGRS